MPIQFSSAKQTRNGIRHGYHSGLEYDVSIQLDDLGVPYTYEEVKIKFEQPASQHTYTPDFQLPNGIIVETKGRFLPKDRKKHLLVKAQHPDLDIRFVFSNPNAKISKGSKTTCAKWCEKNGFKYAKGRVPEEWIHESNK